MSDARVGELQQLHDITAGHLAAYPSRAVGVLGSREVTVEYVGVEEFVASAGSIPCPTAKTVIRQDFRPGCPSRDEIGSCV
jgi:hypothetical protein